MRYCNKWLCSAHTLSDVNLERVVHGGCTSEFLGLPGGVDQPGVYIHNTHTPQHKHHNTSVFEEAM